MGNAFLHGNGGAGGGGLNFNVVGGLTQPANLKENSIWVITNVPITTWIFSQTEPEPPADGKDGPVWFLTGDSSEVSFNALKKNAIEVYPTSAKQYVGGAWVDRETKSYRNGELVEWFVWDGTLFPESPGIVNITGGWVNDPNISHMSRTNVDSSTVTEDAITIYVTGSNKCTNLATDNEIDLTGFSYLKFNVTARSGSAEGYCMVYKDGTIKPTDAAANKVVATTGEQTIELPGGGGLYRIAFAVSTSGSARSLTISEVRLME